MNFEIKNIESFFPEHIVTDAEALLHDDLVQGLTDLGKNLWTMKISESYDSFLNDIAFEVEIQLKGKKVKAFTCECDFFQQKEKQSKEKFCKHIVAGLFILRKNLLQRELKKQKALPSSPTKHKKLTTASVLNSVEAEALKNFVRSYARLDKKFAIALKARFAHAVQVENPKEKYIQLLTSTFNSVKSAKDKFNYQAVNQIKNIIKDILVQVEDAIAMEYFSEAASIIQALLIKLAPNIKRAENYEEQIIGLVELSFTQLNNLLKKEIAPELKNEIWTFCLEEFDRSEHRKHNTQKHFFKVLLELTNEKKQADALLEKIDTQLEYAFDKKKKGNLLLVKMKLLEQFNQKDLTDFINEHLEESEVLLEAVNSSIQNENYTYAKKLAHQGLEMQKLVIVKNQLVDFLLNIALKTQNKKEIIEYARQRFLITYQFQYYHILKNTLGNKWENEVANLLQLIIKQPYSPNKKETLAIIYAEEKMNLELINYIQKIRSLDLLEKYDLQLLDEYKGEVYELYEDFLDSYLRSHLGPKTSTKIRDIFYHLKKIGAQKLVRKLSKKYREQYPERHTLIEELGFF